MRTCRVWNSPAQPHACVPRLKIAPQRARPLWRELEDAQPGARVAAAHRCPWVESEGFDRGLVSETTARRSFLASLPSAVYHGDGPAFPLPARVTVRLCYPNLTAACSGGSGRCHRPLYKWGPRLRLGELLKAGGPGRSQPGAQTPSLPSLNAASILNNELLNLRKRSLPPTSPFVRWLKILKTLRLLTRKPLELSIEENQTRPRLLWVHFTKGVWPSPGWTGRLATPCSCSVRRIDGHVTCD